MIGLVLAAGAGWWWGGYCRDNGHTLTSVILGAFGLGFGISYVCNVLLQLP